MKIKLTPLRAAVCAEATLPFDMLLQLQAPAGDYPNASPAPLNLALVIDRSGSMDGPKLREAKRCVQMLLDRLNPEDNVALVQYNDQVENLLEIMPAPAARALVSAGLEAMTAGGTTALHDGWMRGVELLTPGVSAARLSRVILLSDGEANSGLVNVEEICAQVENFANTGVTTTTVGLGVDFNESLMAGMATAGHGGAHYGERASDLAEAFETELDLMKNLAWKSVRLHILHQEGIKVVNDYPKQGHAWRLPSIAVGSEAWALLRIPMKLAIELTAGREQVSIQIEAEDCEGQTQRFTAPFPTLPLVDLNAYEALVKDELTNRRSRELEAAAIQARAAVAARKGDWVEVGRLIEELNELGKENPWIAASIAFLKKLLAQRDQERMTKEMAYKSSAFNRRINSIDEPVSFCLAEEAEKPSFLRRKSEQGRKSGH